MERDFFALASALSSSELEGAARELLAELEGRTGRSFSEAAELSGASAGGAAAELFEAARELRAAAGLAAGGASPLSPSGGLARSEAQLRGEWPEYSASASGEGGSAPSGLSAGVRELRARRETDMESASMLSVEAVSEAVRRDSRRYDSGYERY